MNIDIRNSFLNDVKKITDKTLKAEIERIVFIVKEATTVRDIPELRKMKGSKKGIFYRIKVGDYRIGVTIVNDTVTFFVCLPRKDIYKFFPN